jgi:hypothetical protein
MRMQRVLHRGQNPNILLIKQASTAEGSFNGLDAGIGQLHIACELLEGVVRVRAEIGHD